jgi:phage-related minor tail protein
MPLATLSIDLVAKLAQFEAGMDKAARVADKRAADIARSLNGVKSAVTSVAGALGVAFSADMLVGVVRSSLVAIDALNDLSDATGVSVEGLSSLEQTAMLTGTTLETVGDVLVKFNNVLKEAEPNSQMAKALKAIGLNASELRQQAPDDALRQVAEALVKYENDGAKARLMTELFGKSARELAPFLKDLAEKGKLNAQVTTEQAEKAEKFNQLLAELKTNSTNAARALTIELIPALSTMFGKAADAEKAFGSLLGAITGQRLTDNFFSTAENVARNREEVEKLTQAVERFNKTRERQKGYLSPLDASFEANTREQLAAAQKRLEFFKLQQQRAALELGRGVGEDPRLRTQKLTLPPGVTDSDKERVAQLERARKAYEDLISRVRERITLAEGELSTGQQLTESQKFAIDITAKLTDGELKLSDAQRRGVAGLLQQYKAVSQANEAQQALLKSQAEAAALSDRQLQVLQQENAARIEGNDQLRDYVKEIGLTSEAIEQLRIARLEEKLALEEQAEAMLLNAGAGADELQAVAQRLRLLREEIQLRRDAAAKTKALGTDATAGAIAAIKQYQEEVRRAGDATRDSVRQGIGVLEEDLVQVFKTGRLDVSNFIDFVLQEFLRLKVVRPLLNEIFKSGTSSSEGGGWFTALLNAFSSSSGGASGSAKGDAFTPAGKVRHFKNGGKIVDRRTRFLFGGGQLGEMGEAGPEGILPLQRGPDGRLGVAAHGAGGQTNNYYYQPTIAAGVTHAELERVLHLERQNNAAQMRILFERAGGR